MAKAKIVSFINYKGGVGKSTSTYHVGCSLSQHYNKRVLLVDIDPQTNLTFLCASIPDWQKVKSASGTIATMYQRFIDRKPLEPKRFIWKTPIRISSRNRIANVDLLPCDIDLIGEDLGGGILSTAHSSLQGMKLQSKEYLRDRAFLRNALREVESQYDYILIDCPPNLYLMTENALIASNAYIVTAIPDHLSTIGLQILGAKVAKIGERISQAQTFAGEDKSPVAVAKFGGVVFVKVRMGGSMLTTAHTSIMAAVGNLLGPNSCFKTHTTEAIGFSEAAELSVPIWMHNSANARRAAARNEYPDIAKELMGRV
jgi:chromosome partitioning protein